MSALVAGGSEVPTHDGVCGVVWISAVKRSIGFTIGFHNHVELLGPSPG